MDPVTIGLGLMSLFGALAGRGNHSSPTTATSDPMLQELLQMQRSRLQQGQPLHEAIQRMAMGLLPTMYQQPFGNAFGGPPPDPLAYANPVGPRPPGYPGMNPPQSPPATPDSIEGIEGHTQQNPSELRMSGGRPVSSDTDFLRRLPQR